MSPLVPGRGRDNHILVAGTTTKHGVGRDSLSRARHDRICIPCNFNVTLDNPRMNIALYEHPHCQRKMFARVGNPITRARLPPAREKYPSGLLTNSAYEGSCHEGSIFRRSEKNIRPGPWPARPCKRSSLEGRTLRRPAKKYPSGPLAGSACENTVTGAGLFAGPRGIYPSGPRLARLVKTD